MNRQEYKKLIKELADTLRNHPHFILIATNGETAITKHNGNDEKVGQAIAASVMADPRTRQVFNNVRTVFENNKAFKKFMKDKELKVTK